MLEKLTIQLTPNQHEFVKKISQEMGISKGGFIRILIEKAIKENKNGQT